jgi:hypothetical protein
MHRIGILRPRYRRAKAHAVFLRLSRDAGGVVQKIAPTITVIANLAIASVSADDRSSAPPAPTVPPSGIIATDEGSIHGDSDLSITFSKSLRILLTVNSTANVSQCTAPSLSYQWAKLEIIDPRGTKSDLGSIDNADLYGSNACGGHHSKTKSFDVAGAKGSYVLILTVKTLVNRRPKSGPYFVYPSIRIEADGQPAVERSFPSYGDEAQITQRFPLLSK